MFACVSSIQAVVELIGPVYHLIYLGTIEWYPGFAYCVSFVILIIMLVMTIYCRWFLTRWSSVIIGPTVCNNSDINNTRNTESFSSIAEIDPIYNQTTGSLEPRKVL